MGVVFEAFDRERGHPVALKTLQHFDAASLRRFKAEFRELHDIEHPNLGELYELLEEDGNWFFTMELVEGESLLSFIRPAHLAEVVGADPESSTGNGATEDEITADTASAVGAGTAVRESSALQPLRVRDHVGFDEVRLRESLRQLAEAINALHGAGKIHRDIKPSNVMVTTRGRVVLLDFGLVVDAADVASGNALDAIAGTPAYMAPEQAAGRALGPSADWYAFGTLLYKALVGRTPFHQFDNEVLGSAKQRYTPLPPRDLVPLVPTDLDDLANRLLAVDPVARPTGSEVMASLGRDDADIDAPSARIKQLASASFVGRRRELQQLERAYERSADSPVVVVVHGDSGMGKSHLVDRFVGSLPADEGGPLLLAGRCYERESADYKGMDGVADSLSRYLCRLPRADVEPLLPHDPSLLPRLFPVLGEVEAIAAARRTPELPNPHEQRLRMFAALRDLLARLSASRPLVITIDDMQWTDADSISLLQEILAPELAPRALVIATMRTVEDRARSELLSRLESFATLEHVELDALDAASARKLAFALLPEGADSHIGALVRHSEGHPMLMRELALAASGPELQLVGDLDDALWRRVQDLPEESRRLLEVVCVAGGPLGQDVSAAAAQLSGREATRAISVLRSSHLARTDGVRGSDSIVAYHDRVRESVIARLPADTMRHWHERIALSLERAGAAKFDPQRLVRHAEAAGDAQRAAEYAESAATHALASMAFDNASEMFAAALRLGTYDDDHARHLRLRLAEALVNAGRGAEAAEQLTQAAVDAGPSLELDCRREAAEQWLISGHTQRGLEALEEVLARIGEALPGTSKAALLSLLWHRALLAVRGLGWRERHADDIPRSALMRMDVFRAVSIGLGMVDTIRGHDFHSRMLVAALRTGERTRVVAGLLYEAVALSSQGGARRLARALAITERASPFVGDSPYLAAWRSMAYGAHAYFGGEYPKSIERLGEAEAEFRGQSRAIWELNTVRMVRLWGYLRSGQLGVMPAMLDEYLRDASRRGDQYMRTTLLRSCHTAWVARGSLEQAQEVLGEARWTPPGGRYHLQHWFAFRAERELALCTRSEGPPDLGREEFARIESSLLLRVGTVRHDVTWLRGRLAIAAAAASSAPRPLRREAAKLARRLRRHGTDEARASGLLVAAAVETQRARDTVAVDLLRAAISLSDRAGLLHHAAAARDRLGRLLGGDEGERLRGEARAWCEEQGVVNAAWMMELYAPGFGDG